MNEMCNITKENTESISRDDIELKCSINGPYISRLLQTLEVYKSTRIRRFLKRAEISIMEFELKKYQKIRELLSGKILAFIFPITIGSPVPELIYDIELPDGKIETDKCIHIDSYEINAKYQKITIVFGGDHGGNSTLTKVILPARYLKTYKQTDERYISVAVETEEERASSDEVQSEVR